MILYDFMYWITTLQLWGNRFNILGAIWLMALTFYTYREIRDPITELRIEKRWKRLGTFRLLCLAIIPVILSHFITDESYTFMQIGFNHFPNLVPFDIVKLWNLKFDVYLAIIALSLMMIQLDIYTRFWFKRNWFFTLFFGMWFFLHVSSSYLNITDYSLLTGSERFQTFWIFYPLSKGLLALSYLSVLKRSSQP